MRILILGDFSGRNRDSAAIEDCRPVKVDVDNFDAVFAKLAPALALRLDGELNLTFRQLDDFHPDALLKNADLFRGLTHIRERLLDASTFPQAAEELRGLIRLAPEPTATAPAMGEDDQNTFERLLGGSPALRAEAPAARSQSIVENTLERIMASYIVPDAPPFQDVYLNAVDAALAAKLREILWHPDFQAMESAWRSLWMLVANLSADEGLTLHVLDLGKQALFNAVSAASEGLTHSALYRLLVEQQVEGFGGEPWSVIVGNYRFGGGPEDVALLAACGMLAARAGGPFIAEADAELLGCAALAEMPDAHDWPGMALAASQRWHALRQSPIAPWLGLALPRVLLRLPYGAETDPIETFGFEEVELPPAHGAFLWGNPAFHCALLLGRAYLENGAAMQPGDFLQIEDLPAYTFRQDGERKLLPCAEICLPDRAVEKITALGLMPFLSHRNGNQIRLARFQALADPPVALRGFWN